MLVLRWFVIVMLMFIDVVVAVNLLHASMLKVQYDGSLLLDYDFIMNIFSSLRV